MWITDFSKPTKKNLDIVNVERGKAKYSTENLIEDPVILADFLKSSTSDVSDFLLDYKPKNHVNSISR